MELTVTTILIAFAGVFLICFMKGAFGGGFSIVGIPLLSIVMDPVTAGGLLAPLFIAMDLFALRYWKPSTWSKPDLALLLPGLLAGIGLGYLLFRVLDHRAVAIVMAVVTLIFVALWLFGDSAETVRPRSSPRAVWSSHRRQAICFTALLPRSRERASRRSPLRQTGRYPRPGR